MRLSLYHLQVTAATRWRRYVAIALLLGLLLGVSFAALAGARRTQSAYTRFLRWGNASTMALSSGGDDEAVEAAVRRFPEVEASASYVAFQSSVLVNGKPDFARDMEVVGTFDGRFFTQDRFIATRGRAPDPHAAGEVAVNEYSAKRNGYRLGQRLDLATYSQAQLDLDTFFTNLPAPVRRTRVRVVGIGLFPDEVVQDEGDRTERMLVTPGYSHRLKSFALYSVQGVILRGGSQDVDQVKQRYEKLVPVGTATYRLRSSDEFHALAALRPLSIALAAFGVISGLAALLLAGQAIERVLALDRREAAGLRSFGAGPRSIALVLLLAPLLAIVVGIALAIVVASLASPLMPIGAVHRIEVDPGISLDFTILFGGALVAFVVLALTTFAHTWSALPHRSTDRYATPIKPSRLVTAFSTAGGSPAAVVGLRFALEPRDPAARGAVRSVIPSAAVAVVAVVAAVTFGSSLRSLVGDPSLYGWTSQLTVIDALGYGNLQVDRARPVLDADRRVEAWSGAYFGTAIIDGLDVPLLGMLPDDLVTPPILEGRALRNSGEAILAPSTARRLGRDVGDKVTVVGDGTTKRLTVVGLAILPTVGIVHGAHTSLGEGALVAPRLVPGFDRDITNSQVGVFGPNAVFIRLRDGTNADRVKSDLEQRLASAADFGGIEVRSPQRPAEIANANTVGSVPALLAGLLALGVMVSLGLALAASVRIRVRELALLGSLGFTRRQIAATVRWQATCIIAMSLLAGVPVGLALGRWSWIAFARGLNVVPRATVTPLAVVAVGLVVLLVANVAATLPAWRAGRVRPARHTSTD